MKKKYLSIIADFATLEEGHLHTWEFFYERLSKSFDKVYIINSFNIRFFPNLAAKIYSENKNYKLSEKIDRLPENFVLFDPKNEKDFAEFLKDKDLFVINNFGKHFWYLKIYYLLKKYKIKQVQISNFGVFGSSGRIFQLNSFKNFIRFILFHFFQTFFNKFTVILSNFGIVPKLEIRFLSNKDHLLNIKKGKFSNFLYEKSLLFAKEIKLVNSRSYDIFLENKLPISEDYIVHLDASLNHRHELELRGIWPEEKIKLHYFYLNKFLEKLSKLYKKEVIVTIHPGYNLEEHKKHFPNFQVLKYKTREYIYQSFIVTAFDSSAVTDAILLKKKL